MDRWARTRIPVWLLPAVAAVAVCLTGCGKDTPEPAEALPAPPPVTATQPATWPAPPASTQPAVTTQDVPGWRCVPGPIAGVAYQYVRDTHTEPFRPSVTIVFHESTEASIEAYATAERNRLVQTTPGMVIVAEQLMTSQTPPVAKIVFQYEKDQQKLQAMQLYFLRGSGQVVIVSFQSLVTQWESLQPEFRQVLAAIDVAP